MNVSAPGISVRRPQWYDVLAFVDMYSVFYLVVLLLASIGGYGPRREHAIVVVTIDLACALALLYVARFRKRDTPNPWVEFVYRAGFVAITAGTYLQLQYILPAASRTAYDANIYAFDMRVFGYEPALAWDQYVTPARTEWFAVFYYSHFCIILAHAVFYLLNGRNLRRLMHLCTSLVLVFCTGHLLYIVVPGYGPVHHFADQFVHPLEGGVFWHLVQEAVATSGAQKDIFPSLHTAGPSVFCMIAWVHRKSAPARYIWLPLSLWTTQIILATMYLRWHYLIDILAGLTLAAISCYAALRITDWELKRRPKLGLPPVFALEAFPWLRGRTESSHQGA